MRSLTLTSTLIGLTLFLLAACSKTAESESNFKETLTKYFADKSYNPSCGMIAIGDGFSMLDSQEVRDYEALQKAGYITFKSKAINQGFLGVAHKYTTAVTEQGKAWIIDIKPMPNSNYASSAISMQKADYCLGTVKITNIEDYTDLKDTADYTGKRVAEVLFDYQVDGIPDNLKDTLGKPFQGTLNGKATLVAMTKGWHVEDMSI